jgi:hypothetical protein
MMTKMDIETSVYYVHLTRLIAREDFIKQVMVLLKVYFLSLNTIVSMLSVLYYENIIHFEEILGSFKSENNNQEISYLFIIIFLLLSSIPIFNYFAGYNFIEQSHIAASHIRFLRSYFKDMNSEIPN